ncbi:hypothetical protein VNO78_25733 [Psophocarpus tetragonolobus]|uniref:Arabidopsis retrotransposon Orf1 C-terminal domain-containing protein n=1 Tax=Psophocarpus tetragonolobus TaxID=3891 RepID=A0AAN9S6Z3_PSOTE
MSSKRPRRENGDPPKETTSNEGKTEALATHLPQIVFGSGSQEERYNALKTRTISPTVYWNEETVQTLGFEDDVDYMFTNIGWKDFVKMKYPVYEAIGLEFLSSLSVKDWNSKDGDDAPICFRLFNTDQSVNFDTINSIFGFPIGGDRSQKPHGFIAQHVWNVIGGCGNFVASSSKVSQIGHPLAKLLQRFMSHTIFGRDESQQHVRSTELLCLWAMLTPGVRIDCGVHMIRHFLQRATQGNGEILFGGLITPIAMHVQQSNELHQYQPKSETVPTFTIAYCIVKNVICKSRDHGYYSVLADHGGIFRLPDPTKSLRDGCSFNVNAEPQPITILPLLPPPEHPPLELPPSEHNKLDSILAVINSLLSEFREHRRQFQAHQAAFLEHTIKFQAHQEEFRNLQAEFRSHWNYSNPPGQFPSHPRHPNGFHSFSS